jgi:penicillin amidase
MLTKWDKALRAESPEAALYVAWSSGDANGRAGFGRANRPQTPQDVEARLQRAVERLRSEQGPDPAKWRYGRMHQTRLPHPFVAEFDLPAVERGGGAGAVGADGASYREIMDVADWDRSVATQVPGESAQPESPYYGNLLPLWAKNEYFPLAFSRRAIDSHAAHRLTLRPLR